jgi:hypothetical protein
MSVLELLRGETSSTDGRPVLHELRRPALLGAGAAACSALVMVLPAVVVWVADPHTSVAWTTAFGVGASLWLLGGGAHLAFADTQVTVVPLLFFLLTVAGSAWGAGRAVRDRAEDRTIRYLRGLLHRPLALGLLAWVAGYAACACLWALAAIAAGPRPVLPTLPVPVLVVPVLAALLSLRRLLKARPELGGPRLRRPDRLPDAVLRGVRPGFEGAALLLLAGMAVCVAMVVLHFDQVSHLQGELSPGLLGGVVLGLGQLAVLPNLGLWAVSFVAGTGFSAVEGASATWTGSRTSLLPMVPILGALPEPGAFPVLLPVVVLLPVLVGAFVAWRALRTLATLSRAGTKLTAVGVAIVVAAGTLGALDVLGGGSLGVARLSRIGAPAHAMTLALLAELAVGACVVLGWDRLRVRRLSRGRSADATRTG